MEDFNSYLNEKMLDIDMSKLEKEKCIKISDENIKATINDLIVEEPKKALF